ncbi:MAG: hypothetical protein IPK82_13965 [Polyangiaceae bacterium]|nr:hypothetical protein [Polyangiaceae bacterium]
MTRFYHAVHSFLPITRFTGSLLALVLTGCSGEVLVSDSDPSSTSCTPEPDQVSAEPLVLTNMESATFIGDTLHLQARVDNAPTYAVVGRGDDGLWRLIFNEPTLAETAHLARVANGIYARLIPKDDLIVLEVFNMENPEAPKLASSFPMGVNVEGPLVLAASNNKAFFCVGAAPGWDALTLEMDLTDPTEPLDPTIAETGACFYYSEKSHILNNEVYASWNHPTGVEAQEVDVYTFEGGVPKVVMNHGYNQSGVHAYGNVLRAAISTDRAVFDTQNKNLFLVVNLHSDSQWSNGVPFTWNTFDVGSKRSLLTVADTLAYVIADDTIRTYDLTELENPVLLPEIITLPGAQGDLKTLAVSSTTIAVTDEANALYLIPRGASGVINPVSVYPKDAAYTSSCDGD